MACSGESTSLLDQGKPQRRLSLASNNFYRYPLQTFLSVIDEDPNESDYDDLDECEIQRRLSVNQDLKNSWKLGLFLAVLSGIFFTATSIMVQYFKVPAMEIFLVRSLFQAIVMGLVAAASPYNRRGCTSSNEDSFSWRLKVWIGLQALLGAVRLYLNYLLLAYLPLGDAVTIMFIEPLFTVVFSFVFLRVSAGLWKILLCLGLLAGMILTVQPPFIFGPVANGNHTGSNITEIVGEKPGSDEGYFKGVLMGIGCAVMGAFCNILINKCSKVRSTVLVFYGGAAGIIVALLGWLIDPESNKILTNFEDLRATDWILLCVISLVGISAIFTMTAALKMVSPTSVSVLKALEIIFAFLFQIIVMRDIPNGLCLFGAALVTASILGISVEERYSNRRIDQGNFSSSRRESLQSLPRVLQVGPTFVIMRN